MSRPPRTLRFSPAVEDYLKTIYALERGGGGGAVSTSALAARLGVTAGSVSAMVKRLAERGLVVHRPYHGTWLTPAGRSAALEVIRHHRLLETFLTEELGMPWERVHAEADVLEHVLSEALERLIAAKLGDPARGPHGDPIPTSELTLVEAPTMSLASMAAGARGRFVRVADSDPEMLRYLDACGIALGDDFEVVKRQPFGGPLTVRFGSDVHALGGSLAEAMRVEPAADFNPPLISSCRSPIPHRRMEPQREPDDQT